MNHKDKISALKNVDKWLRKLSFDIAKRPILKDVIEQDDAYDELYIEAYKALDKYNPQRMSLANYISSFVVYKVAKKLYQTSCDYGIGASASAKMMSYFKHYATQDLTNEVTNDKYSKDIVKLCMSKRADFEDTLNLSFKDDYDTKIDYINLAKRVNKAAKSLTQKEREALSLYYGLNEQGKRFTYRDIGQLYGCSFQYASDIVQSAKKKIKNNMGV